MTFYNLMSGSGFVGGAYSHDWIMAWASLLILAIVSYITYVMSKNDYLEGFNWPASLLGFGVALIMITFFGWTKLALLVGVLVMAGLGFLLGNR